MAGAILKLPRQHVCVRMSSYRSSSAFLPSLEYMHDVISKSVFKLKKVAAET